MQASNQYASLTASHVWSHHITMLADRPFFPSLFVKAVFENSRQTLSANDKHRFLVQFALPNPTFDVCTRTLTHTHNAQPHTRTQVVLIDTYPGLPEEERRLAATDVAFPPPAYRPASCGARCQCFASDFMKNWHTRQHRPGQHPGVLCPHDTYCLYSTGMAGDSLAGDTLTGESHAFNGSVGLDEGGREGQ